MSFICLENITLYSAGDSAAYMYSWYRYLHGHESVVHYMDYSSIVESFKFQADCRCCNNLIALAFFSVLLHY